MMVTRPPSSPFPLIAGIGGGVLLLILLMAVAFSSPGREKPPPRPEEPPPPPPVHASRSVEDTGPILFVCANSPKHPDKEQLLSECAFCPARARFFWDAGTDGFVCLTCKRPFPKEKIKCPDCGKVPRVVRVKHRPG